MIHHRRLAHAPTRQSRHRRSSGNRLSTHRLSIMERDMPRFGRGTATCNPPAPPLELTPLVACDPATAPDILWHIARHAPQLRRWLIANPRADARLLEYVSQAGGPGVREAFEVLFDSFERLTPPA